MNRREMPRTRVKTYIKALVQCRCPGGCQSQNNKQGGQKHKQLRSADQSRFAVLTKPLYVGALMLSGMPLSFHPGQHEAGARASLAAAPSQSSTLTRPVSLSRLIPGTGNKIIPTRSRMSDDTGILARGVEDDPVCARTTPIIHIVVAQDGEFVVGTGHPEVEPFIVVVDVWVAVRTLGLAFLVELVALLQGAVDVALPVADTAAGFDAALAFGELVKVEFSGEKRGR